MNSDNNNILIAPNLNLITSKALENMEIEPQNSLLNRSSHLTFSKIVCCICGTSIEANSKGICEVCEKNNIDITSGISKLCVINYCRNCERYQRPPWVKCELESQDMMNLCLSKIKGLSKNIKIVDSSFVWTEPHSKTIKIKLTIQKEINKSLFETSFIIEFKIEWTQCEDCAKTFTPHIWKANVQIRQKVNHKRTFLFLEQLILKHKAHKKALFVKEFKEGVDFYFSNRSQANTFTSFIQSMLISKSKKSRQLISVDDKSNTAEYKESTCIDIAPICQDDLVILNKEEYKKLGGIGPILLCYKQGKNLFFIDPVTFEIKMIDNINYWRLDLKSYIDRSVLQEFLILSCEEEVDYKKLGKNKEKNSKEKMDIETKSNSTITNINNISISQSVYSVRYEQKIEENKFKIVNVKCIKNKNKNDDEVLEIRSFLGNKIRPGDIFYGYDLREINLSDDMNDLIKNKKEKIPDVILVKKKYNIYKKIFKLKHINMEVDDEIKKDKKKMNQKEKDIEDFNRDIGENKELRSQINLYRDEAGIEELNKNLEKLDINDRNNLNDSDLDIKLEELKFENLNINDDDKNEEDEGEGFEEINNEEEKKQNKKNNKKQIGKRSRKGEQINSDDEEK